MILVLNNLIRSTISFVALMDYLRRRLMHCLSRKPRIYRVIIPGDRYKEELVERIYLLRVDE